MNVLEKLMSDYTHAVHYEDGDVLKQYRCKAENCADAIRQCEEAQQVVLQSCAVILKEDNNND